MGGNLIRRLADEGILIGLTAWTEPSLNGPLYPPSVRTPDQRLRFYASRYPLTEVDSTFYHPLAERTATLWSERTPQGFIFDVKAFRLFTQHPTPPSALWPDLRAQLPAEQVAKSALYARDLPPEVQEEALRRFVTALEPLRVAGRLGILLFQLPRYVYPSPASFSYLEWVAKKLSGLRVGVEFRQQRWMDDEHQSATLDFLTQQKLVYVCVDEPQGVANSVPPIAVATTDIAEVRFHGRNAELWNAPDIRPAERHRYNYTRAELNEWVPRVNLLHEGERPVHLLMNNCAGGFCVRNAAILAELIADQAM